jgi:hypothetical protein
MYGVATMKREGINFFCIRNIFTHMEICNDNGNELTSVFLMLDTIDTDQYNSKQYSTVQYSTVQHSSINLSIQLTLFSFL